MEPNQSVFDMFLDMKKEKWSFEWLPMDPKYVKKIEIIHRDVLDEFNMESGQLDHGCYILTKEFMIKLKSEQDSFASGKILPLFFPRFKLIKEEDKVYTFVI